MNRFAYIVIAVVGASLLASVVAYVSHVQTAAEVLAWPALIISGWAFGGHLITLDDDLRGGWSNPEGSRAVMARSVIELFVKLLVFAIVGWWFAIVAE